MPSIISHAAAAASLSIAFAPNQAPVRFWPIAIASAMLPDADSILFLLRIPHSQSLDHRGFFHSPFLGLMISFLWMGLFFRDQPFFSSRWFHYFFFFFFVWTSHALLDALTNGGSGVAFFSPFSSRRYFFPWTPILVSPLRVKSFFSAWGWAVLKNELVRIWLPGTALVILSRIVRMWVNR